MTNEQRVKLHALIANHLDHTETTLSSETHIFNDLGADNLDEIEIIMTIEEVFEVNIPDQDFETIGDYERALTKELGS